MSIETTPEYPNGDEAAATLPDQESHSGLPKVRHPGLLAAAIIWEYPTPQKAEFAAVALSEEASALDCAHVLDELVGHGLVMRTPAGLRVTDEIRRRSEEFIEGTLGDPDQVRLRLVEYWLKNPVFETAGEVATWARQLGQWELLCSMWAVIIRLWPDADRSSLVPAYRLVPDEVRRRLPLLSWANLICRTSPDGSPEALDIRKVAASAIQLHADWSNLAGIDNIVMAGTIWMVAQRQLPLTGSGRSLAEARRVQAMIEEQIIRHNNAGETLSDWVYTIFLTFAAKLELERDESGEALSRADFAVTLSGDRSGVGRLAIAVKLLAETISGLAVNPPAEEPWRSRESARTGGWAWQLASAARALRALDRLDEPACHAALDDMEHSSGLVESGTWPLWATARALHGTLWGSPWLAFDALEAAVAGAPSRMQDLSEPLGVRMIGAARLAAMNRMGKIDIAWRAADSLPPDSRAAAMARTKLWAGEFYDAARLAEVGLCAPNYRLRHLVQLSVVRAAAMLMDGTDRSPQEVEMAVLSAARNIEESGVLLPLALLPRNAQRALLSAMKATSHPGNSLWPAIGERLSSLSSVADDEPSAPVDLTPRERVLLPLLAGDDSVPDIARALSLSPNTVRKQVVTLRAKFDAPNRRELVRRAKRAGLLG